MDRYKGFIGEAFDTKVEILENGVRYLVDVEDGQKTGFFLDQKYNRLAVQNLCKKTQPERVLDCFTHTGSFALNAGIAGSGHVLGVDASELAGMKLVKDGGYLATCSCSHFMDPELFTKTIREAAANVHKRLRQIEYRTQAADHPILWAADESYYLKFIIFQVCDEK